MIEKIKNQELKEIVKKFNMFVKTYTGNIRNSEPIFLSGYETITIETHYIIIVLSENIENVSANFSLSLFFRFNTKPSFAAEFILNAIKFGLFEKTHIIDISDFIENDEGKKFIGKDATKYLENLFKIHKSGMTNKAMDQLLENVDSTKIPSC